MAGKAFRPTVLACHLRDDGVMGGCEHYRIRIPFQQVHEHIDRAVLNWAPLGQVRKWGITGMPNGAHPSDYDLIVWVRHRPSLWGEHGSPDAGIVPGWLRNAASNLGIQLDGRAPLLDLLAIWKRQAAIVLEYDDDHWTGSRVLSEHEHLDLTVELLRKADAVTVSTNYLRKIAKEAAPDTPVYVLPNCVSFGEWQGWDRWKRWPEDHVVLGLTGSVTHAEDWKVLETVLPRIMRENGNAVLLLQGFVPDYLAPLIALYPDRVYAADGFVQYMEYPGIIRQADIVLCPVVPDDPFNLAKSPIKAVEGYAAGRRLSSGRIGGATAIVSPLDYYKEVVGNGHRGIVAEHEPDEWYEAITALIRDRERRETYGRLGYEWVRKNRSIETQWKLWWDAYRDIYRRKQCQCNQQP